MVEKKEIKEIKEIKEKTSSFGLNPEEMVKAGLHLGHSTSKLHPRMKPYIYGIKKTIHIINLEKTLEKLKQALEFVQKAISEGKTILLVGTKPQHKELIKSLAEECNFPYVNQRWLGGTLTNFSIMRKRIKHFQELRSKINSEEFDQYTKKEQTKMKEELHNLENKFGGVEEMESLPEIVFICDIRKDEIALKEAKKKEISVIAVVDTNANPALVDWPIPASDDAVSSARYILDKIKKAILTAKPAKEKDKEATIKEGVEKEEGGGDNKPS